VSFLVRLLLSLLGILATAAIAFGLFVYVIVPAGCWHGDPSSDYVRPTYCDGLGWAFYVFLIVALIAGVTLPWIVRRKA
jgi:hypothetical protein